MSLAAHFDFVAFEFAERASFFQIRVSAATVSCGLTAVFK